MSEQVMTATAARGLTVEEFWALPDPPTGERHQLIDGEVVVMASPVPRHQRCALRLCFLLGDAVARSGGEAFIAPLDVVLGVDTVVQPDVVVYGAEAAAAIDPDAVIDVLPDLVVEVLSPSTAQLDHVRKRRRYETAGIPEYWIVSPVERSVAVLRLVGDRYAEQDALGPDDLLSTPLFPDMAVDLAGVFDD